MGNNNSNNNSLLDISNKQHILISFNALYELDVGLIEVIRKKYASKKVFNYEKLYQPNFILLMNLYSRKDINPLYIIANDDISKEDLDDYYKQFLEEEFDSIFENSIYTDLINLIDVIKAEKNNTSIGVSILYYNDKQKYYLDKEEKLLNIPKVFVKDIYKDKKKTLFKYDFVYIKSLNELLDLYMLESSLVYIARYRYNLNEDASYFDIDNNDALKLFIALNRNNHLGVYESFDFGKYYNKIKEKSDDENNSLLDPNNYEDGIPFEEDLETIYEGEDTE